MRFFKVMLTLKNPSKKGESLDFRTKESDIAHAQERFNEKFSKWNKRVFVIEISENRITLLLVKEVVEPGADITPLEIGKFSSILYRDRGWDKFSKEPSKLFASVMFREIAKRDEIETELTALSNQSGIDEIIKEYSKEITDIASDESRDRREDDTRESREPNYYRSRKTADRDMEIESDRFNETRVREILDGENINESNYKKETSGIIINSEIYTNDNDGSCRVPMDEINGGEGSADGETSGISDETALKTLQLLIETKDIGRSSAEKKRIISGVKKMLMHWLER